MRTMILLIVLCGTFPEWLWRLSIIWYVLACIKWWILVYKEVDHAMVEG